MEMETSANGNKKNEETRKMWRLIKVMIILTLLSETSKRSFEIDRCNSEINREPIYTLFIFFSV